MYGISKYISDTEQQRKHPLNAINSDPGHGHEEKKENQNTKKSNADPYSYFTRSHTERTLPKKSVKLQSTALLKDRVHSHDDYTLHHNHNHKLKSTLSLQDMQSDDKSRSKSKSPRSDHNHEEENDRDRDSNKSKSPRIDNKNNIKNLNSNNMTITSVQSPSIDITHGLFEIKETSEQSPGRDKERSESKSNDKELPLNIQDTTSSVDLSWKQNDSNDLPTTGPIIGGPLGTIQSEYDLDTLKIGGAAVMTLTDKVHQNTVDNANLITPKDTPTPPSKSPQQHRARTSQRMHIEHPMSPGSIEDHDSDVSFSQSRDLDVKIHPSLWGNITSPHHYNTPPPVYEIKDPELEMEHQKSKKTVRFDSKVSVKEQLLTPTPEPPMKLIDHASGASNASSTFHTQSGMLPVLETEDEIDIYGDEMSVSPNDRDKDTNTTQLTPLLIKEESKQGSIKLIDDDDDDGNDTDFQPIPDSPMKTPNTVRIHDHEASVNGFQTPKKELLLSGGLAKTPKTLEITEEMQSPESLLSVGKSKSTLDEDDDSREPKRLSSADLFAKDLLSFAFPSTNENTEDDKDSSTPLSTSKLLTHGAKIHGTRIHFTPSSKHNRTRPSSNYVCSSNSSLFSVRLTLSWPLCIFRRRQNRTTNR